MHLFIAKIIIVPLIVFHDPVVDVFAEDLFGVGGFHFEGWADSMEISEAINRVVFFGGLWDITKVVDVWFYFEVFIHSFHFLLGVKAEGFVFDEQEMFVYALQDSFPEPLQSQAYWWRR